MPYDSSSSLFYVWFIVYVNVSFTVNISLQSIKIRAFDCPWVDKTEHRSIKQQKTSLSLRKLYSFIDSETNLTDSLNAGKELSSIPTKE